jgi:hypothetical protein
MLTHRFVYEAVHGVTLDNVKLDLDHINGNKKDNRVTNLQLLTHRQNIAKAKIKEIETNICQVKDGSYMVTIQLHGKIYYFGKFYVYSLARMKADLVRKLIKFNKEQLQPILRKEVRLAPIHKFKKELENIAA